MSSHDLSFESDILIHFDADKSSTITQYLEDRPDARNAITSAPALNLSRVKLSTKSPLSLPFEDDKHRSNLLFRASTNSFKADCRTCDHSSTDGDDEVVDQNTDKCSQLKGTHVTTSQGHTQSPVPEIRSLKRSHIDDEGTTSIKLENVCQSYVELEDEATHATSSGLKRSSSELQPIERETDTRPSKRKAVIPRAYSAYQWGNAFAGLDRELRSKIERIGDVETLTWVWEIFNILRNKSLGAIEKDSTQPLIQTGNIESVTGSDQELRELKDRIERDEEIERSIKLTRRMVVVSKRLHLAELITRFIEERDAWKSVKRKKRKLNEPRVSPMNKFVDILFPETILYGDKDTSQEAIDHRRAVKEKFERWIRCGEPWARMVQRYGYGIILLMPGGLSNEHLRRLRRSHMNVLLDYIDFCRPGLKEELRQLSLLLPRMVNCGVLPLQKLVLETVLRDHLPAVGEQCLVDLFQYCTVDQDVVESTEEIQDTAAEQDPIKPAQITREKREYIDSPPCETLQIRHSGLSLSPAAMFDFAEEPSVTHASHLDDMFLLSPMVISFDEC